MDIVSCLVIIFALWVEGIDQKTQAKLSCRNLGNNRMHPPTLQRGCRQWLPRAELAAQEWLLRNPAQSLPS